MKMDQTEKLILEAIDQHRDEIIEFARDIYDHGELGYKEFNTAEKFIKKMKELGLRTETGLAITGTKAYLNEEKKDTASLALLGELDALRIPEHAHANPETDAAHCCGHHAQMAGIFGAALALTVPEIAEKLDGQVVFFATPAEEYGEIGFKNELRAQGKIKYVSTTTSSGTTFTRLPPFVMIGWTRTQSSSRNVSRFRPSACRPSDAADRAFTPCSGVPAAWAALPKQRITLDTNPFPVPLPTMMSSPGAM
jgi:hypothetical protein